MGFKIIGRKDGKKTVSDNSENDVTKITKVLEFLTEAEPSTAIIGSLVRFMWNPGTGTSLCWVQGEVEKRVDPYKKSRKEKWDTNRVVVKNLEIANCWGEEYTQKLPKTMIVDLSRKQTWALGTEVTLDTNGESEAFEVDMDKIPKIVECFDDDTTDIQEEKGAAGGIPIMGISDNGKNQETNDTEYSKVSSADDTSDDESLIDEDEDGQARRLRTMNINEWLTNEKVQDILDRVQAVTKTGRNCRNEITRAIGDTINDAQMGMDQAFIAGTLATPANVARKDSLEHSQTISEKEVSLAAVKARAYLKQATEKAKALAEDDFKQVRHWLESDEDTLIITTDFLKKIRVEGKRSIKLTNDKIKHPGSLGAQPKKQSS